MSFVLGVDAGNTKTIAVLAGLDGRILGSGRGGCGDILGAGSPEKALRAVDLAMTGALAGSGAGLGDLAAACFSMAGADWPEDFALLRAEFESRGLGRNLTIYNDAIGALRAGSPDGYGVSVVCGTGAAVGARAPDGRLWHSSYWQEPQGAHDLGFQTLRAVFRAELGLDRPTTLKGRVLEFYKLPTVEAVLHQLTARVREPGPDVGGLARALLDEAAAGDATARRLAAAHGASLGDYALVAARKVGLEREPFTLVLAGGVLRHRSDVLPAAVVERVRRDAPGVRAMISRFEPVVGAALLALEDMGVKVDAALLDRLAESLPPAALFET